MTQQGLIEHAPVAAAGASPPASLRNRTQPLTDDEAGSAAEWSCCAPAVVLAPVLPLQLPVVPLFVADAVAAQRSVQAAGATVAATAVPATAAAAVAQPASTVTAD